jgi:peptide/nickel transport system substrate-binding protein
VAAKISRPLAVVVLVIAIGAALFISKRSSRPDQPAAAPTTAAAEAPARGGELVASFRGEPNTYNRYVDRQAAADLLALLTQAPLIHVNRTTDALEPWLADSWTVSPDLLTYTLKLRQGITFSDGAPFTSADVLFSFRALYDPKVQAVLAGDTFVQGKPLHVEAPDASTVVVRLPAPFAAGLRLLDMIPMLPRHKLEAALDAGTFGEAWSTKTPLAEIAGLGPFVLSEHVSGQRLVFTRNPRFWRTDRAGARLPYLDKLTVLIIPDQNAEAVRMQAGEIDLMSNADIRPEDYASFKRVADQGRLRLMDVGVGLDPNTLWFNLSSARANDPRNAWLRHKAFRQAVSCAVDREAVIKTAYLGEAVPIYGPVTPGNRTWFIDARPACEYDPAKARALFASAGLTDRNGDGMLEDAAGTPARFSILTQRDHIRSRVAAVLQEELRKIGITVDVVAVDPNAIGERWSRGDYDSIYFGTQASGTDPSTAPGFWLSSGDFHFWNPSQKQPATEWERRTDDLMHRMSTTSDLAERQRLFADVQRIFVDELPALYFVAPKVTIAISSRVVNPQPAPQIPQLLWTPDTLGARPAAR